MKRLSGFHWYKVMVKLDVADKQCSNFEICMLCRLFSNTHNCIYRELLQDEMVKQVEEVVEQRIAKRKAEKEKPLKLGELKKYIGNDTEHLSITMLLGNDVVKDDSIYQDYLVKEVGVVNNLRPDLKTEIIIELKEEEE